MINNKECVPPKEEITTKKQIQKTKDPTQEKRDGNPQDNNSVLVTGT